MEKIQIETFEFSLEERENMIKEILSFNENEHCDSSDIQEKWSNYLNSKLPKTPFLSLVKHNSCENSFICDIIEVEYEQFTAKAIGRCKSVLILYKLRFLKNHLLEFKDTEKTCELTINLGEIIFILGLSDEEPRKACNLALDNFRYFLEHLWFPHDDDNEDEDPDSNWISEHLKPRVKFDE